MDLTKQLPVGIDIRLAGLYTEDANLTRQIKYAMGDLRSSLGHRQERITLRNGKSEWVYLVSAYDAERAAAAIIEATPSGSGAENVHAAYGDLHTLRQHVLVNRAERAKISTEFDRRGGWTRAWAVPNGHVHNSRQCDTCYPTTEFGWLPQVSGLNETEIVELAGERACTRCYPSAPVDVLKRATRLHTAEEQVDLQQKAQRAQEQAEKRAAKAAKGITNPDGSPLRGEYSVIKTEIAARNEVLRSLDSLLWYGLGHPSAGEWVHLAERCIQALAHKQGRDYAELSAEFRTKAEKKHAKERRNA